MLSCQQEVPHCSPPPSRGPRLACRLHETLQQSNPLRLYFDQVAEDVLRLWQDQLVGELCAVEQLSNGVRLQVASFVDFWIESMRVAAPLLLYQVVSLAVTI